MPHAAPIQNNFTSGEFSGLMAGRVDFDRYRSAAKILKNMLTYLQGPTTRRPGTYHCDEVLDSGESTTRCVRFKYSTVSAFVLEFGDEYIRFKKDRAPIYDLTLTITGITNANPGVVTYTGTDPTNGQDVDISGVLGMLEINGLRARVANVNGGANTFELETVDGTPVDTTNFTAYASAGTAKRVYTLTTTYAKEDLARLKFAQSADVLYIWHPDYPERQLSRVTDSSWSLDSTVFLDGPYLPENTTATTLTLSATSGNITITASATTGINGGAGFQTTDVGRLVRCKHTATWGYARITARTSTTVVDATVISAFANTGPNTNWRLGLWSDTTGYPAAGTFYGDRLYRGGVPEVSERFDGSMIGDYDNMAPSATDGTVTDAHAVAYRLTSNDAQTIRWMEGTANGICIGTFEGEWLVTPSTLNEAITPTNVNAKQSTPWGSEDIQGLRAGTAVLFVESGGRRLREMNYLYYENVLQSVDMTVLAEHITKGLYDPAEPDAGLSTIAASGIKEMAFAKKPIPYIYAVRNDGVLLSCAYSKDDKVLGWERQVLGGYSDAEHTTPAKVESVCVIPASDGSYDEVWMIVQRYVNGRVVRYNERLTQPWEQGNAQADAFFVDSGLTYDGSPTGVVYGLWHLIGETVEILADGMRIGSGLQQVPATALIGFGIDEYSTVHVGYGYESDGATLRNEAGSETGTAQGKLQRITDVIFRLYDTLGLHVGPSFDELTEIEFRTSATPFGVATPLYTGDLEQSWPSGYSSEETICWRFVGPLPGTIVAIMPQLVTQDP